MYFSLAQININASIRMPSWTCCFFLLSIFSCKTTKRIAYFQDIPDSLLNNSYPINLSSYKDLIIRQDDLLQITIQTLDSPIDNYWNTSSSELSTKIPGHAATGFTVDKTGEIEMPVLGKIKVEGLTTAIIRDSIRLRSSRYFKDPVVNVRLANFSVNILGEVNKPGNYVLPNEKVSVIDALAIAGDITVYGRKENILLLRNGTSKKDAVRFDLNSSVSLGSPYFYLQQNDIIYVEPNKAKITASTDGNRTRNYALIASGLSVLIILISRLTF